MARYLKGKGGMDFRGGGLRRGISEACHWMEGGLVR